MRIIISGGPGAGCTSTAKKVAALLDIPFFDSDDFFHKPTEPPYQEQYSAEERRGLLLSEISSCDSWVLSGSIASWNVGISKIDIGVFLDIPVAVRMKRLAERERFRFGDRILPDGDMYTGHSEFMQWASEYDLRTEGGRNRIYDRDYLLEVSSVYEHVDEDLCIESITERIVGMARGILNK